MRTPLVPIAPNDALFFEWLIHESELRQFGGPIDVEARFFIACDVRRGSAMVPALVSFTLPIRL